MTMLLTVFLIAILGSWSRWLALDAGRAAGMIFFEGREWTEMGLAVVGIGVMVVGFIRLRK